MYELTQTLRCSFQQQSALVAFAFKFYSYFWCVTTMSEASSSTIDKNKLLVAATVVITTILLLHHEQGSATTSRSNIVVQGQQGGEGGDGEGNTALQQITATIPRQRRLVADIFEQLGPLYTRRAYRMTGKNFYKLHRMLFPYLNNIPLTGSLKKHRNGARNGLIPSAIRLGVALRYFAGGSPYDLSVMHGISVKEAYRSVWLVVDAINKSNQLQIEFPPGHDAQRKLSRGFCHRSTAQIDCCVAAIDGLLIWLERPSKDDCDRAKCGPMKFMCGRKKKFGLNMMGTVDNMGRFVDVEISHPGSTSDYLAFATSNLKAKIEQPGFLAPGLVLFGDNAYGNSEYMVTPYKGSRVGSTEDNFNFYHSQLRIHVECAFGQLVHRWGILRRPIPMAVGIKKTCAMVIALCKLHNFCIQAGRGGISTVDEAMPPLEQDEAYAGMLSAIELHTTAEGNTHEPTGLLHGGDHMEDVGRNILRQHRRAAVAGVTNTVLPQQLLHNLVVNQGLQRPTPRQW